MSDNDALKRWEERMARKPDDPPEPEPAPEAEKALPAADPPPAVASDAASAPQLPLESLPPEVLCQALLLSLARGAPEGEIKKCLDEPGLRAVLDIRWIAQVGDGGQGRISIFGANGKELDPNALYAFFLHVVTAVGGMPWVHERMRLACKRLLQAHEELAQAVQRMAKLKS